MAIVIMSIDRQKDKLAEDPEIISRGFVFERGEKEFLLQSSKALRKHLEKKKRLDSKSARFITISYLADYFYSHTARRPMILPVVTEV